MSNHSPKHRRVTAIILSVTLSNLAVFNASPILAAKNLENAKSTALTSKAGNVNTNVKNTIQQVGQLIVTGTVTVNEKKAITGTTVFTDSRIAVACSKGSSAIVNLGKLGRIELTSGSKLMLRFSEGLISGDLLEGKAVVSTPAGVKV